MPDYDYLIVGAGLSASTIAERLASQGNKILIAEKRPHIAGNVYDYYNEEGILLHAYGPHLFHTNSSEVFDYLSKFTDWIPYQHRVLANVNDMLVPIPINRTTLNMLYNLDLKTDGQVAAYFESHRKDIKVRNAKEAVTAKVGPDLYQKLFEGYTKKQWGTDPKNLSPEITQRIPVRTNEDDRYHTDIYQAMPARGYTRMVERMLDNPNIRVLLNTDYKEIEKIATYEKMIYTGPIDAFFNHKFGRLGYRSLSFKHTTYNRELVQPVAQINYPDERIPYTRTFEAKHATGQIHEKTTVAYEFPEKEGEPYYPLLTKQNQELAERYKAEAAKQKNVYFVGRLADYRYYNMDQAVAAALKLYQGLHGKT